MGTVAAERAHDSGGMFLHAENLLERTSYSGYPLVNNAREMLLIGYIARRELDRALGTLLSLSLLSTTS
jgi:hypothetical protein